MPFIKSDWISLFSDYSYWWKIFVTRQHGEEDYLPWSFALHIFLNCIEFQQILLVSIMLHCAFVARNREQI